MENKVDSKIGINVRLMGMNYSYEDMKGIDISNDNAFRCTLDKRGMNANVAQYEAHVVRRSGQLRLMNIDMDYEVMVTCVGGDLRNLKEEELAKAVKGLVAAKASYLIGVITNETTKIPLITPPVFTDDLPKK